MAWSLVRALLWIDPLIYAATILMGSISLLASLLDSTGRRQHRVARRWARMVLAISGVKVRVTGLENLVPGAAYVFCSNHVSLMDTPLLFGYLPWELRTLAKKELFRIPFLGWHLRRAGHLPVARDDVRASVRNIADAARRVAQGMSIVVFPEGGRSEDGTLGEFKAGGAYIAIRAGVPIVPVGVIGTHEVLQPGSVLVRPGPVELRIGTPIPTSGLRPRDSARILAELRYRISRLIHSPSESTFSLSAEQNKPGPETTIGH